MDKYTKLSKYIEDSWDTLTVTDLNDSDSHIGVPYPFVAPSVEKNLGFVFKDIFYWDSHFIILALIENGREEVAKGMVENLLFLHKKLGYVPNSNNYHHLGRSQPPMLALMVEALGVSNTSQLKKIYTQLNDEYHKVWTSKKHPHSRQTKYGLSRYYNENLQNSGAEDESGWDYTTRFEDRALDFLPIDLNSILYKNERLMAGFASKIGRNRESDEWNIRADHRQDIVNKLLWSDKLKTFVDYDFKNKRQQSFSSLASYFAMYTGLASIAQAKNMRDNLKNFETNHGLTTTPKDHHPAEGKQWAAPNGWAPLHYIVVEGLNNYGFQKDAKRIMQKWVDTVQQRFERDNLIYEKYNVIDPMKEPVSAVYPDQVGFAWTNAVTEIFIKRLNGV